MTLFDRASTREPHWLRAYLIEHSRATLRPLVLWLAALALCLAPFHEFTVILLAGGVALLALSEALRRSPTTWVVCVGTTALLVPSLVIMAIVLLSGEVAYATGPMLLVYGSGLFIGSYVAVALIATVTVGGGVAATVLAGVPFDSTWALYGFLALPVSLALTWVRLDISQRLLREQARLRLARDELAARSSELEQQREALKAARDEALDSAALKAQFLANMSHEIRTPLNGVVGMTSLLLDTGIRADQREYTETIRRCSETLLHLVNDILDFSKIEAGKLDFEQVPFDPGDVVNDVVELLAEKAQTQGLELVCDLAPDLPGLVRGDPGRVRQVLTNLVGNAVKFTRAGEVVVRAFTVDAPDPTRVHIAFEVEDTGVGIAPEAQARLFAAFVQADGSVTRRFGGTGLGLSISDGLARAMGGHIRVRSEPGVGSRFRMTVPFQLAAQLDVDRLPAQKSSWMSGARVLCVDDNATCRTVIERQLMGWGLRPTLAATGGEALEALRTAAASDEPFQALLVDWHLGDMDAVDFVALVQREAALEKIPVIVLAGYRFSGRIELNVLAQIDVWLRKPARPSQLLDALATALGFPAHEDTRTPTPAPAPGDEVKGRVLVVEDNAVNQQVAVRLLEKFGYRADVAGNGREALAALAMADYDAMLLDCQMPVMDGFETARAIRSSSSTFREMPIIAMTANVMSEDRERCLEAGMDDFVGKPVRPNQLVEILNRWIGRRAAEDRRAG